MDKVREWATNRFNVIREVMGIQLKHESVAPEVGWEFGVDPREHLRSVQLIYAMCDVVEAFKYIHDSKCTECTACFNIQDDALTALDEKVKEVLGGT